jgi:hypothetical protein
MMQRVHVTKLPCPHLEILSDLITVLPEAGGALLSDVLRHVASKHPTTLPSRHLALTDPTFPTSIVHEAMPPQGLNLFDR